MRGKINTNLWELFDLYLNKFFWVAAKFVDFSMYTGENFPIYFIDYKKKIIDEQPPITNILCVWIQNLNLKA